MTATLKTLFQKNPKGFFKVTVDVGGNTIRGVFRGCQVADLIDKGGLVVQATVHFPKSLKLDQEEIVRLKELIVVGSSKLRVIDFELLEKGWVGPSGEDRVEPIDRAYQWLYDAFGSVKQQWL